MQILKQPSLICKELNSQVLQFLPGPLFYCTTPRGGRAYIPCFFFLNQPLFKIICEIVCLLLFFIQKNPQRFVYQEAVFTKQLIRITIKFNLQFQVAQIMPYSSVTYSLCYIKSHSSSDLEVLHSLWTTVLLLTYNAMNTSNPREVICSLSVSYDYQLCLFLL